MVDIAFGPEPGPRPNLKDPREAYLEMVRRKRMYGGILLVLFTGLMASGWMMADERNAGGFWDGLPQVIDFPAEVLTEAGFTFDKSQYLPGIVGYYSSPEGEMLSFPYNSSSPILYYNKDIFEKAGLDVSSLETVTREKRPPHFEVISLIANKA